LGAASPVVLESPCHRIALDALTPKRAAAWRHDAPSAMAPITRLRRSIDSDLLMLASLLAGTLLESDPKPLGNPHLNQSDRNRL
jgi:hypothetical protein